MLARRTSSFRSEASSWYERDPEARALHQDPA